MIYKLSFEILRREYNIVFIKADYFATADEIQRSRSKRQDQSPTKRKRRRSKQSSRSHRYFELVKRLNS